MGLKHDIIVVNEFSTKTKGGGSRGGTPGKYVERYMARADAVEDLTPVRLDDNDAYIKRYMARKTATETLDSVTAIKESFDKAQGLGGVAFGKSGRDDLGDISMSDSKIRRVSGDIQKQFNDGKTVLKTVISFSPKYLQQTGIVPPGFECNHRGDYRGNIDQLKLRTAIMEGMNKLSKRFDDLEWVGVIQVDTMHTHCHLCIVDKGKGRVMDNGQQRGKLDRNDIRVLRRGIDNSLDDMKTLAMMASNVTYDKRNARCFVKKFTHDIMDKNGLAQFLVACLPENKSWWRAGTNRREMQKANAIVREYVTEILAQPDSGYDLALREIDKYAKEKSKREELNTQKYREFINNGKERLIRDCMNGVYSVLKEIPDYKQRVKTPMLDVMSMPYEDMADDTSDPMLEFGFKLRSYSSRLKHHKKERQKYHEYVKQYEQEKEENKVSAESKALYDFYRQEEEYNSMLMAKYQYFLNFLPPDDKYQDEIDDIMDYRHKIESLNAMMHDRSIRRIKSPKIAEDYGRKVYRTSGGRFMLNNYNILDTRFNNMLDSYKARVKDFDYKIREDGLRFVADQHSAGIIKKPAYKFDDVKMLDLHHLGYDFPYDAPISKVNIDKFRQFADIRYDSMLQAKSYLERTHQGDFVKYLPVEDIKVMKELSDFYAKGNNTLLSHKGGNGKTRHRTRTVSLDEDYSENMRLAVRSAVQAQAIESQQL